MRLRCFCTKVICYPYPYPFSECNIANSTSSNPYGWAVRQSSLSLNGLVTSLVIIGWIGTNFLTVSQSKYKRKIHKTCYQNIEVYSPPPPSRHVASRNKWGSSDGGKEGILPLKLYSSSLALACKKCKRIGSNVYSIMCLLSQSRKLQFHFGIAMQVRVEVDFQNFPWAGFLMSACVRKPYCNQDSPNDCNDISVCPFELRGNGGCRLPPESWITNEAQTWCRIGRRCTLRMMDSHEILSIMMFTLHIHIARVVVFFVVVVITLVFITFARWL